MPRISRFAVKFFVNNQPWIATFDHRHNDVDGIVHQDFMNKKDVRVRHVTRCKLSAADRPGVFVQGTSLCSLKDEYNWRIGVKQSLQRALAKAGFCKEVTGEPEIAEWNGKQRIYKRHEFVPLGYEYIAALSSFFHELTKKDYPPHNEAAPVPEARTQATIDTSIPAETRNGTAHLGY